MKILHYLFGLPPVRKGGLVKYALDLAVEEGKSETVLLLTPGPIASRQSKRSRVKIRSAGNWQGIPHYRIINPLPIPMANGIQNIDWFTTPCESSVYETFLREISPDIIHMHTLMGIHREFLQAAENLGIPVIYTTHDYFGICPKTDLMDGDKICDNPGLHCAECSRYALSDKRLFLEQTKLYRVYQKTNFLSSILRWKALYPVLRNLRGLNPQRTEEIEQGARSKAPDGAEFPQTPQNAGQAQDYARLLDHYRQMFQKISYFHFNSSSTRSIYEKYLGELKGGVVLISNRDIRDRRKERSVGNTLRLMFLGGDSYYKGLQRLQSVLRELYDEEQMTDIELHIYGSQRREELPFCCYHEPFKANRLEEVFDGTDVLVVPSSWPETFGLVVLEAFSFGVPVIMTDKVGAKDLLESGSGEMGIVTEDSREALKDAIRQVYRDRGMVEEMNRNILAAGLSLDYGDHVRDMLDLYRNFLHI